MIVLNEFKTPITKKKSHRDTILAPWVYPVPRLGGIYMGLSQWEDKGILGSYTICFASTPPPLIVPDL